MYGGGGSMLDTVGAASFEHVGDVGGHGGGDGTGDAVVDDGLTKESVSNGVGFYMVFSGESIDKAVEVGDVTVFDAVVANYEGKINGVDGVGKEAGLELAVAMGQQEGGDLLVGMGARLLKTRDGFIAAGIKNGLPCLSFWINGVMPRRVRTAGEKREVWMIRNSGEGMSSPR
jgi:hypothetical protein